MRNGLWTLLSLSALGLTGCSGLPVVRENPLVVPSTDFEYVWQQTVEVVDEYFDIATENRIDGRIETYPQVASTVLEPWRRDSVDFDDRFEATLQSLRRKAFLHVVPASGGYAVQVEVHKELEDLPHPAHATTGDAVFGSRVTLHREQQVIGPVPVAHGWIHVGRDWKLESRMLDDLACRFGLASGG
jgi:hypothetical protein